MYNCSDFSMEMWNWESDCSRGSGKESRKIVVYVLFLGICPRKSGWKYWEQKEESVQINGMSMVYKGFYILTEHPIWIILSGRMCIRGRTHRELWRI